MNKEKLADLALDLTREFPRSPRERLGDYIIAARTLDKCRAVLNDSAGEYHYDCPLDKIFFEFTGIDEEAFKAQVASGADDTAMTDWIQENAKSRERIEVIRWNNKYRTLRLSEMPDELQEFLEDYIPKYLPSDRVVYSWFDVYDIEEKRL